MSKLKPKVYKPPAPEFPTRCDVVDVKCPCCGRTDVDRVLTVIMGNVAGVAKSQRQGTIEAANGGFQFCWLQMPAGWAHSLPLNWFECRGLSSGLARCPDCIPKPNELQAPQ